MKFLVTLFAVFGFSIVGNADGEVKCSGEGLKLVLVVTAGKISTLKTEFDNPSAFSGDWVDEFRDAVNEAQVRYRSSSQEVIFEGQGYDERHRLELRFVDDSLGFLNYKYGLYENPFETLIAKPLICSGLLAEWLVREEPKKSKSPGNFF